ncbi:MAG: TRAP transporter large permease [Kofleriaceae bacterium]|nr:TRAP transporter large permease [Kofleriaceae bacterium]MCL4223953.1 TRAP transporter large permease [Myxococcales bacterium]
MIVVVVLLGLALIGAPLFVIVGAATGAAFIEFTNTIKSFADLGDKLINPFESLMGKDQFLAIPLFIASGAIMTEGGMARRLVAVARAALGWLPGGLGIASVAACMVFAAITGSSPVTLIAVGSIMFPAMVRAGYPENFSLGLVMTAGSLGCLVMPSLILMIYALAVSTAGQGQVEGQDMFIASFLPAVAMAMVLCLYSLLVGLKHGARERFDGKALFEALREGVWAMALPVIVVVGIYTGKFPPFKAGAVAFMYALVVTTVVHRELTPTKIVLALANAGRLMGMLILIIAFTFGINKLIPEVGLEQKLTSLLTDNDIGPIAFLIIVNVFLIVVGALMDSVSATLVFAPILAPIAVTTYGIDPVHFGVVFVVNMEIGYLAPPVATNLFVAAALFKKPFGQVSRAILPGLGITIAALFVFMFVPTCSKGLVNLKRDQPFYESFPWDGTRQSQGAADSFDLGEISDEAKRKADEEARTLDGQSDEDYYFGSGDDDGTGADGDGGDGGAPAAPDPAGDGGAAGSGAGSAVEGGGDDGSTETDDTGDELEGVQL